MTNLTYFRISTSAFTYQIFISILISKFISNRYPYMYIGLIKPIPIHVIGISDKGSKPNPVTK